MPSPLQSVEAQKKNRRREFLQMFDLEEKQKAFRKGLALFQHLYPAMLDINEQKQLAEEMALMQRKFIEAVKASPAEPFKISPLILASYVESREYLLFERKITPTP